MVDKIYILDDNFTFAKSIEKFLIDKGYKAKGFTEAEAFYKFFEKENPDVVLLDMRLSETNGLEVLKNIKEKNKEVYVIIVTAYGSIENAINAIKLGAYHYLTKPFEPDEILILIDKIKKEKEENYKRKELEKVLTGDIPEIIGKNEKFLNALNLAKKVAKEDTNVLLTSYPESPSGIPGVQTTLGLMLLAVRQGWLDLPALARVTAAAPARVYGIAGKGALAPGMDGDLVVVDPGERGPLQRSWLRSRAGYSPYTGLELAGWPRVTVLGGEIVYREHQPCGEPRGRPLVFSAPG